MKALKGSVDDTTGVFTATSDPGRPSPELAVTTPAWPADAPTNVAASAAPSYTISGLTPETGYTVSVKARTDLEDDGTLDESAFTVVSATTAAPAAAMVAPPGQACHNRYDGPKRAANRKHRQLRDAGQLALIQLFF